MKPLLFGTIYLLLYCLLAFFTLGFGHGTVLFLAPLMPYGLGFVLLLFVVYLFDKLNSRFARNVYLALMTVHYLSTLLWWFYWWNNDDGNEYFMKTWNAGFGIILLASGWYVLGQIIIWMNFYKSFGSGKESSDFLGWK